MINQTRKYQILQTFNISNFQNYKKFKENFCNF